MSKILISGYYGFENLGDEAILQAIVTRIQRLDHEYELTVLSNSPLVTASRLSVRSVKRNNPFTLLQELLHTDLLLSGGGSLLQDDTSSMSIFYYLLLIYTARILRKKVMIYSQGIGPIRVPRNRGLTRFVLKTVNVITVRELYSKKDLIDLGLQDKSIVVTSDPVFAFQRGDPEKGFYYLQSKFSIKPDNKTLGISVRTKDLLEPGVMDEFILFLNYAVKSYTVVVLPFYQKLDLEIAIKLKSVVPEIMVIDEQLQIQDMLDVISAIDMMIATRLHALIFSAVCETPMVAISYDPKIDYLMKSIGFEPVCKIDAMTAKKLQNELEAVENNRALIKKRLMEFVDSEKSKLVINDELLLQLLKTE